MKIITTCTRSKSLSSWIYLGILSFCLLSQAFGLIYGEGNSEVATDMYTSVNMHGENSNSYRIHRSHKHYRNRLRSRKLDTVIDPDERLSPEQRKQRRVIKAALRINGTAPDPTLLQQLSTPTSPPPPPHKEAPKEKPKAPVNFLQANEQVENPTKSPELAPVAVKPMPLKLKPAPQLVASQTPVDAANTGEQQPAQPAFRKTAIPNQQATLITTPEGGVGVVAGSAGSSQQSSTDKKDKVEAEKGNEKQDSKQQLNQAFANVLSVLEFGKSKENKNSKSDSNILSKPDLIPGVLRSIPVSNALAIRPAAPPTSDGVRGGAMTIDVKTGEMESPHHHSKSPDPAPAPKERKKENLMSFLQANEQPEEDRTPTAMPTIAGIKHDEFKDYNGVRRAPQEEKKEEAQGNKQDVMHMDEKKEAARDKEKREKEEKEKKAKESAGAGSVVPPVTSTATTNNAVSGTQVIVDEKSAAEKAFQAQADVQADKEHIKAMNQINYRCETKKTKEERDECEKLENDKRKEVEIEVKERKEQQLSTVYSKKDRLLEKLAKEMKNEYKIRDVLADRKEETEESEMETLFIVFMLILTLLLVLLSLSGFNPCKCIISWIQCCCRIFKGVCNSPVNVGNKAVNE